MSYIEAVARARAARQRLEHARENCAHWDLSYDSDGGHECCHQVAVSLDDLLAARAEIDRSRDR